MAEYSGHRSSPRQRPQITRKQIATGFKAVFRIFDDWGVGPEEAIILLGQPVRATFDKWRKGEIGVVSADAVQRVSYLLGIYKLLQCLFSDNSLSDRWIREPNRAFGGESALQRMLCGDVTDLAVVRAYLENAREGS